MDLPPFCRAFVKKRLNSDGALERASWHEPCSGSGRLKGWNPMKKSLILLTALVASLGAAGSTRADDPSKPVLVTIAPKQAYAPPGFDDNDNAQVVITGALPSTCFRFGPATGRVDAEKAQIIIQNRDYSYRSCWCHYTLIPYVKVVDLGLVPAGHYKIVFEQN